MDSGTKIYLYNLPCEFELQMQLQHSLVWDGVMRNSSHKDTGSTSN